MSSRVTAEAAPPEPAGRRWWPLAVPLVAVGLVVSVVIPSARHQWALSIFRQPTRYTALSFNSASELPSAVVPYEPVKVSFVINNHEGRTEHYRYLITQAAAGVSSTLGTSAQTVAAGRAWTVSTVIRPSCLVSPCLIRVSLPGHPETIDFLASVKA